MIRVVVEPTIEDGEDFCDVSITFLQEGEYPERTVGQVFDGRWIEALVSIEKEYGDEISGVIVEWGMSER